MIKTPPLVTAVAILGFVANMISAQSRTQSTTCTQTAFAAFQSLPKLEYGCPAEPTDTDNNLLKLPARVAAIHKLERALESFDSAGWWNASVDDLSACEIHGRIGEFTVEEKEKLKDGDYELQLLGNHEMRLVVLADPCYATEFAGSNAFLLVRKNGRMTVSQVLNGYASRVANSVGVDFANLNGQTIVEVSTANSVPPTIEDFYFVIDPATNKVAPRKLFKIDNKMSSDIYSDMLMGKPKDFGLPKDATELNVIRHGRLAPSFSAYEQDEHGKIGGRLRRIIYRWNGKFYVPVNRRR